MRTAEKVQFQVANVANQYLSKTSLTTPIHTDSCGVIGCCIEQACTKMNMLFVPFASHSHCIISEDRLMSRQTRVDTVVLAYAYGSLKIAFACYSSRCNSNDAKTRQRFLTPIKTTLLRLHRLHMCM